MKKCFISQAKFSKMCGEKIGIELNALINSLIGKIFIILFSSIDRKILSRGFLDLNINKICFEVLQKIDPYKKKVDEYIENKIIMLSFDEICFFIYTSFFRDLKEKSNPKLREIYLNALVKSVTEIEQYYCNSKT